MASNVRTSDKWFPNALDRIGTLLGLPEYGISERKAGGMPTVNTGLTTQSQNAGLDDWVNTHHNNDVWSAQNAGIKDAAVAQKVGYPTGYRTGEGLVVGGNNTGGTINPNPNPDPNPNPNPDGGPNTTMEMLQRERDRKLAELDDAYNLAQRYGSDARNTLGRKRKGFEEEFANNASDIYDQFGRNRADLQVSSEGQDARTTRGLLAQGVGGSGLQEALRRNESARQQNYGQVREGRQKDERINTANKNERMSWADEQDAAIDRYLGEALMRRNQGRNTTLDNFSNTLGGLISQAQQAAQALALSGQNIGSTEIEGIPLAGLNNGTFLNELQTAYQNSLGRDTSDTGNINANFANLSLTEQDKRLRGLLA